MVPLLHQDGLAGLLGPFPLLEEGNIVNEGVDAHPGRPQALDQVDPLAGGLVIIPDAARRAGDRGDDADALVLAQGVRGDVKALAHFGDGHGKRTSLLDD